MRKAGIFVLIILAGVINQRCLKTVDYDQQEQESILQYLQANNITVQPTASGLYYVEQEAGTGLQPQTGDTVSINYIASRLNGIVFDTNIEDVAKEHNIWKSNASYIPFSFVLGTKQVIDGIDEGVGYMKEGGKTLLVIPSKLAYNDYQPLAFYIELLEVKHDTTVVR